MATNAAALPGAAAERAPGRHRSWTRFVRRRTAVVGALVTLMFLGAMAGAQWIAPYAPGAVDYNQTLAPPSFAHPAGTDDFGRDILTRLIYGSRYSLGMGLGATCLGAVAGAGWGMASAFYGGFVDDASMRVVDVMLAFPGILLAIAIVAVLGAGMINVIIAVGVYTVPTFARLVRGPVIAALNQEFVSAARAVGAGNARIMFRHLLPVAMPSIIIYVTLRIGTAVLTAGSLSFLGLGVQPPTPEWGAMLAGARLFLNVAPHMVIAPGVAISLAVLGFNLLGDGMRDALDPRLRD